MLLDYETLKLIWWLLAGALLIGFAVVNGFDLGIGVLLPWVARRNEERRVLLDAVEPVWKGNQVWFVIAGGVLFAAWPQVYAVVLSAPYAALIAASFALVLHPVGFDLRGKVVEPCWRTAWDAGLFLGGMVPALAFGIAFGNLLLGLPFRFEDDLQAVYAGGFFDLLHPFALLAGIVGLSMLAMHGGTFLQLHVRGELLARARRFASYAAVVYAVSFAAAGAWVAVGVEGHRVLAMPHPDSAFVPMDKTVLAGTGDWLRNYSVHPLLSLVPLAAFAGALGALLSLRWRLGLAAFLASSMAVACTVLTAGLSLFPFVIPSSLRPDHGITLWDAASGPLTLQLALFAAIALLLALFVFTGRGRRVSLRGRGGAHVFLAVLLLAGTGLAQNDVDGDGSISPKDPQRLMDEEYARLELARSELRRRLDRLQRELGEQTMSAKEGYRIVRVMSEGYRLLKNPRLRAAFSSPERIREELARVELADRRLDRVEEALPPSPSAEDVE